ncbi:MAG: endonuclease III [Ignavibacteria bacterium RIFOXYB2_FULL_35_12]|nr:MAG: endonuclease III [Ignavibacteria bacterium GWC2_35_8]OGU59374.1 MAG: endonuclease III [Ignavibacteria bacterium GWF2_35_20]OGU82348.1 MAG: endonuclease III [Ignavibacteria bacterium RIFOXYA2_FULL_35_9]OGU86432.1 MAG: endonuclease III [Ignavibacteria bacterium RIFOXYA12_FULL_35_25]OGU92311.1 MAG: endonuclease III [Ignavibacteria bacterium RIFOXYC12_FULL_35_11]OGU97683.1 MAG: endonuclease III [Ignavibacteria bacterium RIFOXYB12_FULL_35_14]OGU98900.1 MAG: endonuclease III [Ignavibacteria
MLKAEKERAIKILSLLKKEYPEAEIALEFVNPFQLLIATILSAQCTDARVNIVTKALFKKYKSPKDFINASDEELKKDIFSTGFYRQKAKSIKACCKELVSIFDGNVPSDFESLIKLPGVGRKTASVVAGNGFGIPAIAVDTHVKRLSNLLGFIKSEDPEKIEARLKELLPEKDWIISGHLLMSHGRKICIARKPKCKKCVLGDLCPSFDADTESIKVKK